MAKRGGKAKAADTLYDSVVEYLQEMDNDIAPDYTMRRILRDNMRRAASLYKET